MNATVIFPAYEPEDNLKELVNRVWELGNQVIVVDDGSSKTKSELFRELKGKAIVLRHEENMGKGAAIKTALLYIKENLWDCDVIGVMDADGQHLPDDMERLLRKVDIRKNELLLGVRKIGRDMPLKSRFGNAITRGVFHLLSGAKVSDTQTGLRAFPSTMVDRFLLVDGMRYEYETNILFYCVKNRIPLIEVPIQTIYHDKVNSCSHFRIIRDSFRIYKDMLKFVASSLSGFLLDYVLFCLLVLLFPTGAFGVIAANVLARIASGIYNYMMNCKFVFGSMAKRQTALAYTGLAAGILLMNNMILQMYHGVFLIPVFAAKILTEITLFIISFLVQKKLIFRKKKMKGEMVQV